MSFKIHPLSSFPDATQICAAWSFGEWGQSNPGKNLSDAVERYKKTARDMDDNLPASWLAILDNTVTGMASLKISDHPDLLNLSPWLASVYVHTDYRGTGVAKALCLHVKKEAQKRGFDKLYLFTHTAESMYSKLGWQKIRELKTHNPAQQNPDILMVADLIAPR